MYKAVIFDLDGTLLNTLDDLAESVNYALRVFDMPERTVDEVRRFVGNGVKKLMERAVPKETADISPMLEAFRRHYTEHCEDKTAPYKGIPELLEGLNEAGIKTAVVSNKIDSAVKTLCKKYFGERITAAIGDIDGRPTKPAPDAVYAALTELGVKPEEAVYVGDSDVDVMTAQNSGMDGIAVTWGFRPRRTLIEAGAKVFADTPMDILRYCTGDLAK